MDLATKMNVQHRDHMAFLQADRDACPGRRAYVDRETARRHALNGMRPALCQRCYRFHNAPPTPKGGKPAPKTLIERAFGVRS